MAGSILTWWSGYGFGTQCYWSEKRIDVLAAFALAIAPAVVLEDIPLLESHPDNQLKTFLGSISQLDKGYAYER
jgi:hypothetical protein